LGILFLLPVVGLSFMLGGVQLIFKKIDAFMQLVQFALVALVALPVNGAFIWARFLPGTLAANLMRDVMVKEAGIMQIPVLSLLSTAVIGIGYFLLGLYVFKQCERNAMKDGSLAHY